MTLSQPPSRTDILEIDAEKLRRMLSLHVQFQMIDIRSKVEFEKDHIQGAFHLEEKEFLAKIAQMVPKKDMPLVIYDADGVASGNLVLEVEKLGFTNIVNLQGGFETYKKLQPRN